MSFVPPTRGKRKRPDSSQAVESQQRSAFGVQLILQWLQSVLLEEQKPIDFGRDRDIMKARVNIASQTL